MADTPRSSRQWIRYVRALRDRAEREREGVCFVEGIRQVLAAYEGGHTIVALLLDPRRLRSKVARRTVSKLRDTGTVVVELTTSEFERISALDNPVGMAAIVAWRRGTLADLTPGRDALYLLTDRVVDAGNLGTLIRTADSLGASGVVVHGGVDPAHPAALRASLGTAFRFPIVSAETLDDVFNWTTHHRITTVATSATANKTAWDADLTGSVAIIMGSEGEGLAPETIERCDQSVLIPMTGTATSLNVGVAAGILLYEALRQRRRG